MDDSTNLIQAWTLSKQFHCRPSELYGIEHPVNAFYFDRAIFTFGTALENDLNESTKKVKKPEQAARIRDRVMTKWLDSGKPGVYRDPVEKRSW